MDIFEKRFINQILIEAVKLNNATIKEAVEFKIILEEDILLSKGDIIVDLSECDHIDSTFMGVLVISMKKMKSKDRDLVLIEPKAEKARAIFSVTDTYKVFKIYKSLDDALNNVKASVEDSQVEDYDNIQELNLAWGVGLSRE
ncbi:MAG TPA: STAS domain-containing protein [Ignavibacteriaceae bacterium]|nr:STAS domain-containing protein [Ignavibacteriaceae bacterium]